MRRLSVILLALLAACLAAPAQAHDARPLSVAIAEQAPGLYRVVVRAPPTLEATNIPAIVWPGACEVQESAGLAATPGGVSLVSCPGGLDGRDIRIEYPVYNPSLTTLFRLQAADGGSRSAVLPPDTLIWTVPPAPDWRSVARDYVTLGFSHIWEGPDHLMFVAGLMMLARRPRRIFLAVTGFTAAHSITLSLATLGLVRLPVPIVEAMIALSILFLAAELARNEETSFSRRYPVVLSFVFGLLHGFGFASALREIGLPTGELATGLVFFNLGVEAGQIAFVLAAGVLFVAARRLARALRLGWPAAAPAAALIGAYALGIPAALWFLQRLTGAFAA